MDTRQIECFFRLAENLSFAKTANEMFLTQSTVSREIRSLEQELDIQLFERDMKNVRLTQAGEQLLLEMKPIMNSLSSSISRIRSMSNGIVSQIRIGFFHSASILLVPEAMRSFRAAHPEVQFLVHSGNPNHLNALFHTGQMDVVFGIRSALMPSGDDRIATLYDGRLCAIVPESNPLSEEASVNFRKLNGQELLLLEQSTAPVGFTSINALTRLHCPDSLYTYCSTVKEQQILLSAGIGIALGMQYSIMPSEYYRNIPFEDPDLTLQKSDYAVMWHKERFGNHIDEFVSIVRKIYTR